MSRRPASIFIGQFGRVQYTFEIWSLNDNFEIESSRSKKCLVKRLTSIRGANDDNPLALLEPVHLSEQLIDGLIRVRMQTALRSFAADTVDLVDEYDTRRACFGRSCNAERDGNTVR